MSSELLGDLTGVSLKYDPFQKGMSWNVTFSMNFATPSGSELEPSSPTLAQERSQTFREMGDDGVPHEYEILTRINFGVTAETV